MEIYIKKKNKNGRKQKTKERERERLDLLFFIVFSFCGIKFLFSEKKSLCFHFRRAFTQIITLNSLNHTEASLDYNY